MKFFWDEIYETQEHDFSFYEATYRAPVPGGWLVRHEVRTDFQYCCIDTCADDPINHRHIDTEGYQNLSNTMVFVPDPNHEWETD